MLYHYNDNDNVLLLKMFQILGPWALNQGGAISKHYAQRYRYRNFCSFLFFRSKVHNCISCFDEQIKTTLTKSSYINLEANSDPNYLSILDLHHDSRFIGLSIFSVDTHLGKLPWVC